MCLGQGHNALTQVIVLAKSLDLDQARQSFSIDFEAFYVKWVQ